MTGPGLIHLYCGEGKGKTTAAMGLALRALGHGQRVVIVQFLKSGRSGEAALLEKLGAVVLSGKPTPKFTHQMTPAEKAETRRLQTAHLARALDLPCDLLVLDEACAACRLGMVEEDLLRAAVLEKPGEREVVLTGRGPAPWMLDAADYITEMQARRHPYEKGIAAREGVEY